MKLTENTKTGGYQMSATNALGKAGELRVASELLLRGHEVFLTFVDSGADLILGNGKRVQVKTGYKRTRKEYGKYKYTAYTFCFQQQASNKEVHAHPLKGIDFIILWAIDDNLFYILPVDMVRGKRTIQVGKQQIHAKNRKPPYSQYLPFKNHWELLQSGAPSAKEIKIAHKQPEQEHLL